MNPEAPLSGEFPHSYEQANDKERNKPEIQVSAPSLDEEVARVKAYVSSNVLTGVILPSGASENYPAISGIKTIVSKEYNPDFYNKGMEKLIQHIEEISSAYTKILSYKELWGFDLEPKLSIKLTRYGKAGSYNMYTKELVLRTDSDGNFGSENPTRIVTHEAMHFATEHLIQQYGVSQREKERIVNTLCATVYPNLFPDISEKIGEQALEIYRGNLEILPEVFKDSFIHNAEQK